MVTSSDPPASASCPPHQHCRMVATRDLWQGSTSQHQHIWELRQSRAGRRTSSADWGLAVGWLVPPFKLEPPAPAPTYIQQGCTTCPPAHSARGWLLGHSMGALSVQSSRGEGAAGQRAAETISYGEVAREEQGERGCLVEKERDPTEVWFWLSARPCTAFGSVGVAVVVFCFSSLKSF